MITRRQILAQSALAVVALATPRIFAQMGVAPQATPAPQAAAAPVAKPNILIIYTDDQNPGTVGFTGAPVPTPNIDRLAREGVIFTKNYITASVCTPSRYSCLTGRYASRCNTKLFTRLNPPGEQANVAFTTHLDPGGMNLATVLRDAGYYTGFVGKWHTGWPDRVPIKKNAKLEEPEVDAAMAENHRRLCDYVKSCGFDDARNAYYGNVPGINVDDFDVHNQEWVTQGALDFFDHRDSAKPFFLWYCTTLQHAPSPYESLKGDWRKTPAGLLKDKLTSQPSRESVIQRVEEGDYPDKEAAIAALWLDDSVGALLKRLEETGQIDNTLIIYMSDNGTRAGKGTCYDGGAQTPACAYWKGHIQPGTVRHQLVHNIDLAPTILEVCGVTAPAEFEADGKSLLPLLADEKAPWRDHALLEIGHTRAVTDGRYKYIALRYSPEVQKKIDDGTLGRKPFHMDTSLNLQQAAERAHPAYRDADQLYDLQEDPQEQVNLAKDPAHAERLERMKKKLSELLQPLGRKFGEFVQMPA